MLLVIFKKYFNTLLCASKILNEFLVRLLALTKDCNHLNLLWKCKHRYRFESCVHGTAWLQLSVPRHIARLFFIVYAVIDRITTTSQVELGAELSGFTAKFWTFWRRSFSPFIAEQSDHFFIRFSIYSCSNSFKCSFSNLLESLATKHRYVTSTSVLNSDKFL